MTIAKEVRDAPKLTIEQINAIMNEKLNAAIDSKEASGDLAFSTPDNPKPSTIDLSRFGLQNPDDLRVFLLSPAGETVTHEIGAELAHERAIEEERQLQIQEEIITHERRRGLLFHWLLAEEAEAQKAQAELIQEQEKILNDEKNFQKKAAPPESTKTDDEIYDKYSEAIEAYQKAEEDLEKRVKRLETERERISEKHSVYQKSFDEFDNESSYLENLSVDKLEVEKDKLQKEADAIADEMAQTGDEKKLNQLVDKLNTIGFKIANVNDLIDTKKDKKFINENGEEVSTYKKAAFVVPKDKTVLKDGGEYYLVPKGTDLDTFKNMPQEEKNRAKKDFQDKKDDIQLVKKVVADTKDKEIDSNTTNLAQSKAQHTMIKNQVNSLQSARANAKQALESSTQLGMSPPDGTVSIQSLTQGAARAITSTAQSKPQSTPMLSQQQIYGASAAFVKTVNPNGQRVTWGSVLSKIKTIQNPQIQDEAEKYFTDEAKKNMPQDKKDALDKMDPDSRKERIKEMMKQTPVPETTMNSFLKHMARFGEDAYKEGVADKPSPTEQRQEQISTPMAPS